MLLGLNTKPSNMCIVSILLLGPTQERLFYWSPYATRNVSSSPATSKRGGNGSEKPLKEKGGKIRKKEKMEKIKNWKHKHVFHIYPTLHTLHSSSQQLHLGFLSPSSSLVSSLAFSLSCLIRGNVNFWLCLVSQFHWFVSLLRMYSTVWYLQLLINSDLFTKPSLTAVSVLLQLFFVLKSEDNGASLWRFNFYLICWLHG